MIETAKYRITGLVDIFDEQGVITGQYPVGSVQELSVEAGTKAVAEGRAEAVSDEEAGAGENTTASKDADADADKNDDEDAGPVKSYKIIGEIFPLDEDGEPLDTVLEIDSIQEVPESVGKGWVEDGLAEEVE